MLPVDDIVRCFKTTIPICVVPGASMNKLTLRALVLVLAAVLFAYPAAAATTNISAEPIPNGDVVGAGNLAKILAIGYSNLEAWSNRLLTQCRIVDSVIGALSANGAISTVNAGNTGFEVAAGGFEAVTDPTYVGTLRDAGPGAVSAADVRMLDNALGYVLNQGGTVHFRLEDPKAYDF